MDEVKRGSLEPDKIQVCLDGVTELTTERVGMGYALTNGGSRVFIEALVVLTVPPESLKKLGLGECPMTTKEEVYLKGLRAGEKFQIQLSLLSDEFCNEIMQKLSAAGFRIECRRLSEEVHVNGKRVGPGSVVYLKGAAEGVEKFDTTNNEAIELANGLNFSLQGVRMTVKRLDCGIISGGPIYTAVADDPDDSRGRLLLELLGLGKEYGTVPTNEFNDMRSKVETIWGFMLQKRLRETDDFGIGCEKLMKDLMARLLSIRIHKDNEIWAVMQDEISNACPAFDRLSQEQQDRIFHRIKVRLGLEADDL